VQHGSAAMPTQKNDVRPKRRKASL